MPEEETPEEEFEEELEEPLKVEEPTPLVIPPPEKIKTSNLEDDARVLSGAGNFKVGESSRSSTTGTQVITGVGFEPKLIKVMAVFADASGSWSIGHATSTADHWCMGVRADGTAIYNGGAIIDAKATGENIAAISAVGSDGFTLNWSSSNDVIVFAYECWG